MLDNIIKHLILDKYYNNLTLFQMVIYIMG